MMQEEFTRKGPLIATVFTVALLLLHHWYAVTEHRVYFIVVFVVPMFAALAIGGLVYPPILWSIGPRGRNLPAATKTAGVLVALGGLAAGFCLAKFVYHL